MTRLELTPREARVVRDALVYLSAYTAQDLEAHLGWNGRDQDAWASAQGKAIAAAAEADR